MIDRRIKLNIQKSIDRVSKENLNTTIILLACCFIDGLGKKTFYGGPEYRFKRYIKDFMPETYRELKVRSLKLKRPDDFCLQVLWRDVRCGLVHEIDPKSKSIILGRTGKSIVHQNTNDKRYLGKDLVLSSPMFFDNFLLSLNKL